MSIDVTVIKEKRAVLQTWHEPVDAEQMDRLRDLMDKVLLPAADGKLHIIADFQSVHSVPDILVRNGLRMLYHAHANMGVIIFVSQNATVSMLVSVLIRFFPKHTLRLVHSCDEAFSIIDSLLIQ